MKPLLALSLAVAPFAGAWIETFRVLPRNPPLLSRPSRARGLKHVGLVCRHLLAVVAPFAGAWIETLATRGKSLLTASRPSRARGLKLDHRILEAKVLRSRPSRARGLKQNRLEGRGGGDGVAPFAGAWIETQPRGTRLTERPRSRPSRARGLKHKPAKEPLRRRRSRPSRARGLKHLSPYRTPQPPAVAPFAGAWIETAIVVYPELRIRSRPSRARGLKHRDPGEGLSVLLSRPSRARGLKLLHAFA